MFRARLTTAIVVLSLTLPHGRAQAQAQAQVQGPPAPPSAADSASAELLFDQGRKLLDEGRLDEACAKLEASQHIEPAVGTLLNLGECNERRGRLATAWTTYRAAASLAETRQDVTRAEFARKHAKAIEPRLPMMTVRIHTPEPSLVIKRDGVVLESAAWGTPLPVDPGAHLVEAAAPGKVSWSKSVAAKVDARTVVDVPALAPVPEVPATSTEPAAATTVAPVAAPKAATSDPGSTMRSIGFASGGAALVALGIGTIFAVRARSQWSEAEPHCDAAHTCDAVGVSLNHEARTSGDVATAAILGGIALLAAGVTLVLLAPHRDTRGIRAAILRNYLMVP
jgi:serine/threonine-protein kinase